jgi:hypothetical protein
MNNAASGFGFEKDFQVLLERPYHKMIGEE